MQKITWNLCDFLELVSTLHTVQFLSECQLLHDAAVWTDANQWSHSMKLIQWLLRMSICTKYGLNLINFCFTGKPLLPSNVGLLPKNFHFLAAKDNTPLITLTMIKHLCDKNLQSKIRYKCPSCTLRKTSKTNIITEAVTCFLSLLKAGAMVITRTAPDNAMPTITRSHCSHATWITHKIWN